MAVKLRMTRMGRRHIPFFRINAVESRTPRDGRIIEKLGHYDPLEKDPAKQIVLNLDRAKYWIEQGAVPSETVAQILLKKGISSKWYQQLKQRRTKARLLVRKAGKPFTKAEKKAAKAADQPKKAGK